MKRFLILSLLAATVALPLPAGPSETTDADALVERYLETFNAPDPVALAALYAEDGLVLPPSGGPVRGREAIRNYWSRSSRKDLSFRILQKSVCGEAGFFVGSYLARETRTGRSYLASPFALLGAHPRQVDMKGNFALGLRRGDDGRWRIASDMWTENYISGFIYAGNPGGVVPAAHPGE
jgi:ketosteroid isomerase-like protein